MSDTPIAPALTPAEWVYVFRNHDWLPQDESPRAVAFRASDMAQAAAQGGRYHMAAALCHYEQPFGFTRAEWEVLSMRDDERRPEEHELATLALAKIAALLPPEP